MIVQRCQAANRALSSLRWHDYQILDLVPEGRDEDGRVPFWVRRHDKC